MTSRRSLDNFSKEGMSFNQSQMEQKTGMESPEKLEDSKMVCVDSGNKAELAKAGEFRAILKK